MSQERQHYTALMAFSSSAAQVWKLLNNFGNKQLYSNNMHANLAPDEAGGWSGKQLEWMHFIPEKSFLKNRLTFKVLLLFLAAC